MFSSKRTKEKIIVLIFLFFCVLAVIFITGSYSKGFGRFLIFSLPDNLATGNMYDLAELNDFKEVLPRYSKKNSSNINSSSLLIFGDSFLRASFESPTVPNILADDYGLTNYYHPNNDDNNIFKILSDKDYIPKEGKTMIFEREETVLYVDASIQNNKNSYQKTSNKFLDFFNQSSVEYLIKNNYLVRPWRLSIKEFLYHYFGEVDSSIGGYSKTPPMLFSKN